MPQNFTYDRVSFFSDLFCIILLPSDSARDVKIDIDGEKPPQEKVLKTKRPLQKWKSFPNSSNNLYRTGSRSKKWTKDMYSDILQIDGYPLPKLPEEEEAVGVITMEDVIEELLQVKANIAFGKISVFILLHDSSFVVSILTKLCRRRYSMRQIIISRTHDEGLASN